jgi:transcriptional regulator with XRE-family HTH domain
MRIDDLLNRLRAEARRKQISQRQLAKTAGLHENTLLGFHTKGWSPSIDTIRALEAALFGKQRLAA